MITNAEKIIDAALVRIHPDNFKEEAKKMFEELKEKKVIKSFKYFENNGNPGYSWEEEKVYVQEELF